MQVKEAAMVSEGSSKALGRAADAPVAGPPAPADGDAVATWLRMLEAAHLGGDVLQVRRLGIQLLAPGGKLSAVQRRAVQRRLAAYAVDPYVLRVGLATFVLYAAACFYAGLQH